MSSHHEPFKTLGPIDWTAVPKDDLSAFLLDVFDQSSTLVDSVPAYPSYSSSSSSSFSSETAALQKEWKETKVNAKDNPLGIRVYKLASKDGKGAWFARSSLHRGLSFETWKQGLEKEFAESMKVTGSPGSGNIRGIGADKRVEHQVVDGTGELQVFQLSAQFPGPTSPRDFITLLLTSDHPPKQTDAAAPPRKQFMIVSKPCIHEECPPRSGIIRGQYESVEIVREVQVQTEDSKTDQSTASEETAIEWLMITRSDPGGSVPRFMIERGTPPGIVGDAGKFLKWISSTSAEETPAPEGSEKAQAAGTNEQGSSAGAVDETAPSAQRAAASNPITSREPVHHEESQDSTYSSALYSMITGALGKASYLASGIAKQFSSLEEDDLADDSGASSGRGARDDVSSDTSSIHSFTSAVEKDDVAGSGRDSTTKDPGGSQSEESRSQTSAPASQHEKELQKLVEKRLRLEEKMTKEKQRMEQKHQSDKQKDAASLAKAREKHERELAKQEAKFKKEVRRLDEKREQEIRKSEEKERKNMDKREKAKLSHELERTRFERDEALKKVNLLEKQVQDLQEQNTGLEAKMEKLGHTKE